ncbi:MAG: hypothetical protein PHW73_00485 [Atribacterota bacterium]|nr:hypothetical protein [Atribacterota bacterium]
MTYEKWVQIGKDIKASKETKRIYQAITHHESRGNYNVRGQSGEFGAAQYLPSTFYKWSYELFNIYLEPTPENQDKVAIAKIRQLIDNGYSVKQIFSIWNSGDADWRGHVGINNLGVSYNVPQYVQAVYIQYLKQPV